MEFYIIILLMFVVVFATGSKRTMKNNAEVLLELSRRKKKITDKISKLHDTQSNEYQNLKAEELKVIQRYEDFKSTILLTYKNKQILFWSMYDKMEAGEKIKTFGCFHIFVLFLLFCFLFLYLYIMGGFSL